MPSCAWVERLISPTLPYPSRHVDNKANPRGLLFCVYSSFGLETEPGTWLTIH